MHSLKYLNKYFVKYKWRFLLGILFVASSNFLAIYSIINAREAINFIREQLGNEDIAFQYEQLYDYALMILCFAIGSGLFLFLTRQTLIVMSRMIEFDMKNEIYAHYQRLDMAFYKQNNTGDLMNRISEDVGKTRMYIGPAVMYIVNTTSRFIMTITVMIQVNSTMTMYVLLPLPILAILIYYISSTINKKSTKIQEQLSLITTYVQETFSGIRVVKAYGRENDSVNRFRTHNEEYKKNNISLVKVESLFHPSMILLVGISNIIIVYIGGKLVIAGEVDYGNVAEFMLYVNSLTWPIASLGWVTSLIQRAAASQTRINEFLFSKPSIDALATTKSPEVNMDDIVFKNVSFTYPETGIEALKNVSFTIKKGKTLAIIGKTGSGKSTILNVLCRQFDVKSGDITLGGKTVKEINLPSFRSKIGIVPQEVFLFSDTIANNIGFAIDAPENRTELIELSAKKAAVYDNIMGFPDQFETTVGERGITLSGGQKQRISIARAIINQPQLLLFDDCLSAVDTATEETILKNLNDDINNTTTVIISHRISTIKKADYIVVMSEGAVVEQGVHRDLLDLRGHYFELHQQQLLEEEE